MFYFASADLACVFSFTVVREFSSCIQTPYSNFPPLYLLSIDYWMQVLPEVAASVLEAPWPPQGVARGTRCPSGQVPSWTPTGKGHPSVWSFLVWRLLLKPAWRTRAICNTRLYPAGRAAYPVLGKQRTWRGGRFKRLEQKREGWWLAQNR